MLHYISRLVWLQDSAGDGRLDVSADSAIRCARGVEAIVEPALRTFKLRHSG